MAEDDQALLTKFNATDNKSILCFTLPQLFERVAANFPTNVALIHGTTEITYEDLNVRANRLARMLAARGIGRGDVVGVMMERCADLVETLLAVQKAGAAYVPIDPALPTDRIQQMMDDAEPKLVLSSHDAVPALPRWEGVSMTINEARCAINPDCGGEDLDIVVATHDLAYIMYTSGSTGKPKGVEIRHGGLGNLLLSLQQDPGCTSRDRLLAITTISFDMAAVELYLPLICGATVVVASTMETRSPEALVTLMKRHTVTILQATPVTWQMLLDSGWQGEPRLEKIFCGGEALSRRLADQLLACGDAVWNMYGPTEVTVYASIWRVQQGESVLIGRPISNVRLYVLNEDFSLACLDSLGELYIGGAGVAKGYNKNCELSSTRFLPNPFHDGFMYCTGDLARFSAPGKLAVLGRADSQVKIRGYRIELGDIEAAMTEHPIVRTAVVLSRDERLVAYYVQDPKACDTGIELKGTPALENVLRTWLAGRLPPYMVPAFFVELDEFPQTPNGKIDRKALPDPTECRTILAGPANDLELRITLAWAETLGHNRIDVNDNFFEIGGDSASVIRLQRELKKQLGRPVLAAKLFEHYTVRMLAEHLANAAKVSPATMPMAPKTRSEDEHIAIISMACRLPGGVNTPEDYWELLEGGLHGIVDVPKDRWDATALHGTDRDVRGTSCCDKGGFLETIDSLDASFFGISPLEARQMDPMQYMALETCWEGFERAGYSMKDLRGSQTGVYMGISSIPAYHSTLVRRLDELDGYAITGSAGATLSGRISYILGLEGPSMTVDTACSSSLVATHLACNAIRTGECDLAIAAGVTLMHSPGLHVEFSRLGGMSADGHCRTFSDETEGTGWGEGSAVVLLKRLSDAQRDGDHIHAVLRGTAVNHGGRSATLTTPSGSSQAKLVRTALAASRVQPNDIDYIEAHGTATRLGDPIEITALEDVFRGRSPDEEPLWIGSVKSNLGHTQAAAGLAGVLKVALAMEHGILPKTLHVANPTPAVDWDQAHMRVVQENQLWQRHADGRPRRAGISAFGIGGTNAHVVMEEAPAADLTSTPPSSTFPLNPIPFLISGQTPAALLQQISNLRQHIATTPKGLSDTAFSLACTRNHFRHRTAFVASNKTELLEKLELASASGRLPFQTSDTRGATKDAHLAMLFTGQGCQYPGMGKELSELFPVFHEIIIDIAAHFSGLEKPLLEVMWAEPTSESARLLNRADFAQPALFALEMALWRLWTSWGVQPHMVLGHSIGELAAACAAGVMNLDDACRLVLARGCLMHTLPSIGTMVSLEASAVEVLAAIETLGLNGELDIASHNTPTQTVVSGDVTAAETLSAYFRTQDRKAKKLQVSHAFHSHHIDSILDRFQAVADTVRFNPPKIPIVSSVTGKLAVPGQLEAPTYWVEQARQAVRFSDGISTLREQETDIFLELGPQPVLSGMAATCLADDEEMPTFLPSLHPGKASGSILPLHVAYLHVRNLTIDWRAFLAPFGGRKIALPTYPFQRQRFQPKTERSERAVIIRIDSAQGSKVATPTSTTSSAQDYIQPNGIDDRCHQPATSIDHLQFEISWCQATPKNTHTRGSWGLVSSPENATWAKEVHSSLSSAGINVVEVQKLEEAEKLAGLLQLWDSDTTAPEQARDFTTKALVQLQAAVEMRFTQPLVWVTRQAVGIGNGDRVVNPGAGALWGLIRTAQNEHPELHLRLIDLGEGKVATSILGKALSVEAEPECVVRDSNLFTPQMQRTGMPIPRGVPTQPLLRSDGTVLITGGLGGVGQRVARWLVKVHKIRDLLFISRRGTNTPGAAALVEELSTLGAKATIIAGDLADFDHVQSILNSFNSEKPLRGVIHAAGALKDSMMTALTPQHCDVVFSPKVQGAWNLHMLTQDMDLDMFVMFSSISGIIGTMGQGNYSAANTFLDSLAFMRRARGLAATSIAWGVWAGEGMGAGLKGKAGVRYEQLGLRALASEQGLALLERCLSSRRVLTVAAALDLDKMQTYYQDAGAIPPLYRRLLKGAQSSIPQQSARQDIRDTLAQAPSDQHATIVLLVVREAVAKVLGFASLDDVDPSVPLQDIGIDSLTAVLIRNQLVKLTNINLSVRVVFQYPNLQAFSQYLLSQLEPAVEEAPGGMQSETARVATSLETCDAKSVASAKKGCLDVNLSFDNVKQGIARPETVFLTGATGFVGAFILSELLKSGIATCCLVRAASAIEAKQRLVATLESYELWEPSYALLLTPVVGNIAEPLLGMNEAGFSELAGKVDAICHSAALVDWMRPLEDYLGPNVYATHEVLRLASRGRGKAIHFISSIATLPKYLGHDVTEEEQEYGYATSKYMAERMVAAARWRGAKASVYRLPFVGASASRGSFRLDRGDFLHNLIAGSVEMGSFPLLETDLSAVLPVDFLAKSVVGVMTDDLHRIGLDFDYLRGSAQSFGNFFGLMAEASGDGQVVPFIKWKKRALDYAASFPRSSLARIAAVVDGLDNVSAAEMLKVPTVGDNVFGLDGCPNHPYDAEFACKYLERINLTLALDTSCP
uniref:Polyketide synthase n=1 Tax=Alternaria alternantherae TaxID=1187899 RepID=A0A1C9HKA1_9PLEO|nr:polyketide synthase [Alternaria alternantherae]